MRKPVIFGMSVMMALCSLATAADRVVPDAYPTIQAAIDAAANGDSVVIKPGTYSGAGNRGISFKGAQFLCEETAVRSWPPPRRVRDRA